MNQDNDLMKAFVADSYDRPDSLALRDVPQPVPGEGMVLVKVSNVSLNPLDRKLLRGELAQMMPLRFPFIPCADLSGQVVANGSGAHVAIGTRIAGLSPSFGALAEYCTVPVGPRLAALPAHFDGATASALPMVGLTAIAVERAAAVTPGQQVAVIGAAGGVGTILLQLLREAGAHVTAGARAADANHVLKAGANEVVIYDDQHDVIAALAIHRSGYDIVIDFAHQGAALERALSLAAPRGKFVSTLFGPPADNYRETVDLVYIRLAPQEGDLARLIALSAAGKLDANLGKRFTFSDTHKAFAHAGANSRGKTIIDLTSAA